MDIRNMRREDMGQTYRIACSSLDQYYTPDVFEFFLMQWPKGQIVACLPSGKVVGFLCGALLTNDRSAISLLAVDEEYRNLGIGNDLLENFKMASMLHGCRMIQLEVRNENTGARMFYKKHGFLETEILDDFYNDHGTAVRMMSSAYPE